MTIKFTQGGYDRINPMEKISGTTTDIYLKNNHTWGCLVYFWMQY